MTKSIFAGRPASDEKGFTLVELLVYVAISVIVLGLLGAFLINSLNSQRTVSVTAAAATQSELVSRSVTSGVSNAAAVKLQSTITGLPGAQLLTARTLSPGAVPVWQCQAWFFNGQGAVYTTRSNTAIDTPTNVKPSWLLLAESGVTGSAASGGVFSNNLHGVDLAFALVTGDGPGVKIDTSVTMRNAGPSAPCF